MNHKKTDKNHIKKQFDVKKFVYNKDYFKYYPYYNPIIHYKYKENKDKMPEGKNIVNSKKKVFVEPKINDNILTTIKKTPPKKQILKNEVESNIILHYYFPKNALQKNENVNNKNENNTNNKNSLFVDDPVRVNENILNGNENVDNNNFIRNSIHNKNVDNKNYIEENNKNVKNKKNLIKNNFGIKKINLIKNGVFDEINENIEYKFKKDDLVKDMSNKYDIKTSINKNKEIENKITYITKDIFFNEKYEDKTLDKIKNKKNNW